MYRVSLVATDQNGQEVEKIVKECGSVHVLLAWLGQQVRTDECVKLEFTVLLPNFKDDVPEKHEELGGES